MSKTKQKTRQFNVMLTENEHEVLRNMAETYGCSAGQVVRMCIRARSSFLSGNFCCADGTPCFAPHMHAGRQVSCQNQS